MQADGGEHDLPDQPDADAAASQDGGVEAPTAFVTADAQPDGEGSGQVDATIFLRVSDGLRDAFAQVTATRMRAQDSARWQRRLIAITNVAKRDLPGALEQLERFERDWNARRR